MSNSNAYPAFGSLFAAGAALVSPVHETLTGKPLHDVVTSRGKRSPILVVLAGIGATLSGWRQRRVQRASLADLSDHMLRDIGVTRQQALEEIQKPFWRR